MSSISVNTITDASGGSTTSINGYTPTVSNMAGRNRIINGGFDVWQRGTSGSTSGSYVADRFWFAGASSVERSTQAPSGFTYSIKVNNSGTGNSIGQPIELVTGSAAPFIVGETVTLSVYAKTNAGTDTINATIAFRDSKFSGTNQSSFGTGADWNLTTEWQRFTTTFTVPAINATNTLAGLEIYGIDTDVYITGVQLEAGSTATPFEHRQYGQELALCQRYFEVIVADGSTYGVVSAMYNGTSNNWFNWQFKVTKRAAATIALGTGSSWSPATPTINANTTGSWSNYSAGFTAANTAGLPVLTASSEL